MRISGGRARGIPLRLPRGSDLRPATDRLRQGLFSSLGPRIDGARFFDFFAGTGSYGLEALSRGASGGVFVERDRASAQIIRDNLAAVARSAGIAAGVATVSCSDALLWAPAPSDRADVIFCDPPFDAVLEIAESLFRRFAGFIRPDPASVLVFEMPGEVELTSAGWKFLKRIGRGRGQPTCCLYALEV